MENIMLATPFNPETDFAPLPFDRKICDLALELKQAGLRWKPHVGCFVWDHQELINTPSPFPHHIYFILNLNRFINIFKDADGIISQLVWIPTWHQARQLAHQLGVPEESVCAIWSTDFLSPGQELAQLYHLILSALKKTTR
jgi:hypothetical protein